MIGNDIVDILQSRLDSNWRRKGFIQKLFTDHEQLLIRNSAEPEIMVWLLWSMKEAAYKIYNRKTTVREFIPKKLQCTIHFTDTNHFEGQVICFKNLFHTKTTLASDALHTIAVTDLQDFDFVIEVDSNNIIKDKHGIPNLFDATKNIFHPVSKSNHGRFEKTVAIKLNVLQ